VNHTLPVASRHGEKRGKGGRGDNHDFVRLQLTTNDTEIIAIRGYPHAKFYRRHSPKLTKVIEFIQRSSRLGIGDHTHGGNSLAENVFAIQTLTFGITFIRLKFIRTWCLNVV